MRINSKNKESGFSLLELVVVVAIIVILGLAVTLLLKPAQMLARARDATRISDMDTLSDALEFAQADAPITEFGGFDLDGDNTETCANEDTPTVYVSVPSDNGEGDPDNLPPDWVYKRVLEADIRKIDGDGWIPIDMTAGGTSPPLSSLPVDPINSFASGSYYTYACTRNPHYELTARLASDKYVEEAANDGGPNIALYEVGTDLMVTPFLRGGYEEEFGNFEHWTLTGSATVDDDGVLHLNAFWDSAISPLVPLNESQWEITGDFFATTISVPDDPDSGMVWSTAYTDENGTPTDNSKGYPGNGNHQTIPLSDWTSRTWNYDSSTNEGITWIKFTIRSDPSWTAASHDVRNVQIVID